MEDDKVHDHVEDLGGQGLSLDYAAVSLKQTSKVSSGPGHHVQAAPVYPKMSDRPEADPIHHNNHKTPFLVQGIV